jgi:hypothetical protein
MRAPVVTDIQRRESREVRDPAGKVLVVEAVADAQVFKLRAERLQSMTGTPLKGWASVNDCVARTPVLDRLAAPYDLQHSQGQNVWTKSVVWAHQKTRPPKA